MNNIDNSANVLGVNSRAGNSNSVGMSSGNFAPKQINYDKYLLNTLEGLATINRPYVQLNSTDRIINCDGVIRNFKQSSLKDSGFLAGLKSLSYTTEGARLIKQSIRKNIDNSVSITFKGAKKTYNITEKEFQEATQKYTIVEDKTLNGSSIRRKEKVYARGDSNILAFELALEKLQKDIQNENIPPEIAQNLQCNSEQQHNLLENITEKQVYYLLSGKDSKELHCNDNNDLLNDFIEKYKANPNRYATSFKVKNNVTIRDVYQNPVRFDVNQSYALRNIDYTSTIFTDMKDTTRLIRIPTEIFVQLADSLSYQDILKENPIYEMPNSNKVDVYDIE